jgi:hypothetical protein
MGFTYVNVCITDPFFGCAVYYDAYCVFCFVVLVRKPGNTAFSFGLTKRHVPREMKYCLNCVMN